MEEEFDEEVDSGAGSKPILIVLGIVVLLLVGGGVAAYMTGMLDELLGIEATTAETDGPAEPPPPPPVQSVFYPLPTMLSNLAGERGPPRFLKFTVSLELSDTSVIPRLRKYEPRITDILQTHFRELRIDDLRESRGIPVLRAQLRERINAAIHPGEITNVLLNELLIQ